MNTVPTYPQSLPQGDTYTFSFLVLSGTPQVPVNLTGCTALMQVRDASGTVVFDFKSTNGKITLQPAGEAGRVVVSTPKEDTATKVPGDYLYDFRLLDAAGQMTTQFGGPFTITPTVTKP
jgi:hypothetical protein